MTHFAKTPDILLSCDGPSCLALPKLAPRIYVPAKENGPGNHRYPAVTLAFPHLHYCETCWNSIMRLSMLLDSKAKAKIEERGKKIWPMGVKPDFDAALIQPIEVFSPEYGKYMQRIGLRIDGLGYSLHNRIKRRLAGMTGWL